uniref:TLDc domain-containing protein n=1 Tax=Glossina austeni TaxID=7395 RepID=A0A1A9V2L3_GLOAU
MYAQEDNSDFIDREGVTRVYTYDTQLPCSILETFSFVPSQNSMSLGYVCCWFEQNLIPYRGLKQGAPSCGIELQTPVLEQRNLFTEKSTRDVDDVLNASIASLAAGWRFTPPYSKPQQVSSPSSRKAFAAQIFMEKLPMMPSHWTLLYNPNQHGLKAIRFLRHVLGYGGPTLILIHAENDQTHLFAAPGEWKVTHLYLGGDGS